MGFENSTANCEPTLEMRAIKQNTLAPGGQIIDGHGKSEYYNSLRKLA